MSTLDHKLEPEVTPVRRLEVITGAGRRRRFPVLRSRVDYGRCRGIEIQLKDGALDRVYGGGVNPDPAGFGPPDIPHKRRNDD